MGIAILRRIGVWSKPFGGDEQALLRKLGSQLRAGVEEFEQTGVELGELKFVPTTYDHTLIDLTFFRLEPLKLLNSFSGLILLG